MCEVKDERLQAVVNGEFLSERGKLNGAYTTVDDAFVLVNVNLFERLLYNAPVSIELSYEEVKAKYAERIIADYIEEQSRIHEQQVFEARRTSAMKAVDSRRKQAKVNRINIIRGILLGESIYEIETNYGVSRSLIYSVFSDYKAGKYDLYADYKQNPKSFEGVSAEQIKELLNLEGSFKELNEMRNAKAQAQAIEKEQNDAKIDAFWTEVKEKYETYQAESTQKAEKVQVAGADVATIDSIQSQLGVASEAPVVKEHVIEERVFEVVNTKKVRESALDARLKESALAKRTVKAKVKNDISLSPIQEEQESVCELKENEVVTEETNDRATDEWGNHID